jgi:hypothetical protein
MMHGQKNIKFLEAEELRDSELSLCQMIMLR